MAEFLSETFPKYVYKLYRCINVEEHQFEWSSKSNELHKYGSFEINHDCWSLNFLLTYSDVQTNCKYWLSSFFYTFSIKTWGEY